MNVAAARRKRFRIRRLFKNTASKAIVRRVIKIRANYFVKSRLHLPGVGIAPVSRTVGEIASDFMSMLDMRRNTPRDYIHSVLRTRHKQARLKRARQFRKRFRYQLLRKYAMVRIARKHRWSSAAVPGTTGLSMGVAGMRVWPRRSIRDMVKPAQAATTPETLVSTAAALATTRSLLSICSSTYIPTHPFKFLRNLHSLRAVASRVKRVTRPARRGRAHIFRRGRALRRLLGMGRTETIFSGLTLAQYRLQKRLEGTISGSGVAREFFKAATVPTYSARARVLLGAAQLNDRLLKRSGYSQTDPLVVRSRLARNRATDTGIPLTRPQLVFRPTVKKYTPKNNYRDNKHNVVIQPQLLRQGQRPIGPDGFYIKKSSMEVRRGGYFGSRGVTKPMRREDPRRTDNNAARR